MGDQTRHLEGVVVQVGERLNSIDRRLDSIERTAQSRDEAMHAGFGQHGK